MTVSPTARFTAEHLQTLQTVLTWMKAGAPTNKPGATTGAGDAGAAVEGEPEVYVETEADIKAREVRSRTGWHTLWRGCPNSSVLTHPARDRPLLSSSS